MRLIRVVAPHFVAGFESDGIVRRTAPILKVMRGWSDARARKYMARKGWKASEVPDQCCMEFGEQSPIKDTTKSNFNNSPP